MLIIISLIILLLIIILVIVTVIKEEKVYRKFEGGKEYVIGIDKEGTKRWKLNGQLHRELGPAVEFFNGTKEWFLNNERHRENGPAIDGRLLKVWYKHGKVHREDGPAVIFFDGSGIKQYHLNGTHYPDIKSDDELIIFNIIT
jgi:hypothetical protein